MDFDFSVLRFDFPDYTIKQIASEVSDKALEDNALLLLNKSAIFFMSKLISEGEGATVDNMSEILDKWNFKQFDIDAKEKIKAEPISLPRINIPTAQPTSSLNSMRSMPAVNNSEQSMQMKLMGMLKKFQ